MNYAQVGRIYPTLYLAVLSLIAYGRFGTFWTRWDLPGPVRMRLDRFGCVRKRLDTFGQFWKNRSKLARGGWPNQLWHRLWPHFFWPTFWLHCILYFTYRGGFAPHIGTVQIQCSQKVGQKQWSHNLCQTWEDLPHLSFTPLSLPCLGVRLFEG